MKENRDLNQQLLQELKLLRQKTKDTAALEAKVSELQLKLDHQERRFQSVIDNINVGLYRNTAGPKGRFIDVNPALVKMLGYGSFDEILNKKVSDLYLYPSDRTKLSEKLKHQGYVRDELVTLQKKDGTSIVCSVSAVAVKDQAGSLKYFDGVIEDISERIQAEKALRQSEAKFRNIVEASPMGVYLYELQSDNKLVLIGSNPAADVILKIDNSQFIGKTIEEAFPPLADTEIPQRYREAAGKGIPWKTDQVEYEHKEIKGAYEVYVFPTSPGQMAVMFLDIKGRKRAEEKLKSSLKEKEVLLQEIHHRVKNNMQIISSLLNLQSYKIEDEQVREMFRESRDRIRAMALIHEKLYQSKDLAQVNLAQYIESLCLHLFHMYCVDASKVRIIRKIEDVFLNINTAIPIGLVINELVSNAVKHAFPDGSGGEIELQLSTEKDGLRYLNIKDNGIGLPDDFNRKNLESLGMQLIFDLVSQIGGDIQVGAARGTSFRITF